MSLGYVYVLYNPSMEGVVKIGRTQASSEERAAEISRATGVPMSFIVVHDELVCDCVAVEKRLHDRFAYARLNPRREFFRIPLKDAVKALQEIAVEFRDPAQGVIYSGGQSAEMFAELQARYHSYIKPDIKSIKMVQRNGLCFLEVTSTVHANLNDERVERVDLGFIAGDSPDGSMFSPIRDAGENAYRFINELDPYSIVMCTPLFTEEACREVARKYEK